MIRYTKETLEEVVRSSTNYREVLLKFERNQSMSTYKTLKRWLGIWEIDTSHFTRTIKVKPHSRDSFFIINSPVSRHAVKKRIIKENLINYRCQICKSNDEWLGKKISLILDHINGINNDNRLENLRFLCPNCNATLDTHCRKKQYSK